MKTYAAGLARNATEVERTMSAKEFLCRGREYFSNYSGAPNWPLVINECCEVVEKIWKDKGGGGGGGAA